MASFSPFGSDSSGLSTAPPTPPQTPGRPSTPGTREGDEEEEEVTHPVQRQAKSSPGPQKRPRNKKISEDATAQPKRKAGRPKKQAAITPTSAEAEASASIPAKPVKKLTIKLSRKGKDNGGNSESSKPQNISTSSNLRAQLNDLADSEDEDEDAEIIKPGKRRGAGSMAVEDDDQDEDEEDEVDALPGSSAALKRKRQKLSSSSDGPKGSKKKFKKRDWSHSDDKVARKRSDEEFVGQSDDSDDAMSSVASDDGGSGAEAYEEKFARWNDGDRDFKPATKRKKTKKASGNKNERADGTKAGTTPQSGRKGDHYGTGSSKSFTGQRKGGSKPEPKSVPSMIRASAAATSTSASAAASPAGRSTMSGASGIVPPLKRPPQLNKAKASLNMWDSLVGSSSKPAANPQPSKSTAPAPSASKGRDDDKAGVTSNQDKNGSNITADSTRVRPPPPSATPSTQATPSGGPSLPRPLGINHRPQQSNPATPSTTSGHGNFRDSTITIHVTPGLNGQHWDKSAYRSLRLVEKDRYRNPREEDLFDLLQDAEVIVGFEEEWRSKRILAGSSGLVRWSASKATQYGSGREYARGVVRGLLKERRGRGRGRGTSKLDCAERLEGVGNDEKDNDEKDMEEGSHRLSDD